MQQELRNKSLLKVDKAVSIVQPNCRLNGSLRTLFQYPQLTVGRDRNYIVVDNNMTKCHFFYLEE